MACYISSNDNRHYAAVEATYGTAAGVSAANRFPAVRLEAQQELETAQRRDKTGSRTFPGLPSGFRSTNSFGLLTYMAAWDAAAAVPKHDALIEGALGSPAVVSGTGTVQSVTGGTQLAYAAPHGLTEGQAVSCNGEIRFVEALINATTVLLNAPFAVTPALGAALNRTATYRLAKDLPGVSIYDYWDPAGALQRVLAGCGIDRFRVRLNADFHQFEFRGEAREIVDSLTFQSGLAGLTSFPAEPAAVGWDYSLTPGNLGQVWMGTGPSQFFNVVDADIVLDNGLILRNREFGVAAKSCLSPGTRDVRVNLRLLADTNASTHEVYQAAKQRSPLPMMIQMGQQTGSLCGLYLKAVTPEAPELDDSEPRLEWNVRGSRAQGTAEDELVVAFA